MSLWPPFLGAGIRVTEIATDWRTVSVQLRLSWFNRNYVGCHFGGSLCAMTDPFPMLMLMQNLGREYRVWDQRTTVTYVSPGRGTVTASFRLDEEQLQRIRQVTADGDKHIESFDIEVRDAKGTLIARVHKEVYIRRKPERETETLES